MFESARQQVRAVAEDRAAAASGVAASARSIAAHDHRFNAFLATNPHAQAQAVRIDESHEARKMPLAGLPVAIKDLTDTAGITTTYGSALFADHLPSEDDLVVARLVQAGAVVVGKTMTPEFGFGAICRNALKGPTQNPWDLALTSGGSSGGSAVAVATGMVSVAHGTDFGGSVRTPASFCGVLSHRPTPGAIPSPKRGLAFDTLATHGFIARSVDDLRLVFDAVAGPDLRDPTSLRYGSLGSAVRAAPRFAATVDFGVAPVSAAVRAAFATAVDALEPIFGRVAWRHPDCEGAIPAFHVLRQASIRYSYGHLLSRRAELSRTVAWAIDQGDGITATQFLAAEARRSSLYRAFMTLFEDVDVLLAPAASVLPWRNEIEDVTEIDGQPLATVIDYLAVTFLVSLVGCPVVTLPAWTAGPIPFGIQLIGRPGEDRALLDVAETLELRCGFAFRTPPHVAV